MNTRTHIDNVYTLINDPTCFASTQPTVSQRDECRTKSRPLSALKEHDTLEFQDEATK
jgi:hypothetical protein